MTLNTVTLKGKLVLPAFVSLLLLVLILPHNSTGQVLLLDGSEGAGFTKIKKEADEIGTSLSAHPDVEGYNISDDTDGIIFSAWHGFRTEGGVDRRKKAVEDISSFVKEGGRVVVFATTGTVYSYLSDEISNAFGVSVKNMNSTRLPTVEMSNSIFGKEKIKIGCSTTWYKGEKRASNRVTCSGSGAYFKTKDDEHLNKSISTTTAKRKKVDGEVKTVRNKRDIYIEKSIGDGEIVMVSIHQRSRSEKFGPNLFFNDENYGKADNEKATKNMIEWLISKED